VDLPALPKRPSSMSLARLLTIVLALAAPLAQERDEAGAPSGPRWFEGSLAEALREARATERWVLVELWATWCPHCARLEREVLADAHVQSELEGWVALRLDGEKAPGKQLMADFGALGFPTLVVLRPDGEHEDSLAGALSTEELVDELQRARRGEDTLGSYRRRLRDDPDDLEARFDLAMRLGKLGDEAGSERELAAIEARDPEGTSLPRHMLALYGVLEGVVATYRREGRLERRAVLDFVASEPHARVRFEGHFQLARLVLELAAKEDPQGERAREARDLLREAWADCPAALRARKGIELVELLWQGRGSLTEAERAFALEVARAAAVADGPDASAKDALARALFLNGDAEGARAAVREAIALQPGRAQWREDAEVFGEGG